MEIIRIENLIKTYGQGLVLPFAKKTQSLKTAIDDVSFSVNRGEIVALLGENGAGKSTLIKMLTGILYPSSGRATIAGHIPWEDRKKYTQKIGLVMGQKSLLYWDIPVKDSLLLCKAIFGLSDEVYSRNLKQLDTIFSLKEVLEVPMRKLSLGLRMKCELVASMLHMPEVLFLDEPTIGLDVKTRSMLLQFLKQLRTETKTTILLATHNLQEVDYLADRIILLNHGKICFDGAVTEMKSILTDKTISFKKTGYKNLDLWLNWCEEHFLDPNSEEYKVSVSQSKVAKTIERLMNAAEVECIQINEPRLEDALMEHLK